MAKGAKTNLGHYAAQALGLLVGDATMIPLHSVGSVVTDPPYGREASTRGRRLDFLLQEFLPSAYDTLSGGGFLCICCPSDVNILRIAKRAGFELIESHMAYVHRSLTRRILVLRKKLTNEENLQ